MEDVVRRNIFNSRLAIQNAANVIYIRCLQNWAESKSVHIEEKSVRFPYMIGLISVHVAPRLARFPYMFLLDWYVFQPFFQPGRTIWKRPRWTD